MVDVLPLLAAAALVGVLHMSAPDHWVTLCVLGQRASWSRNRLVGFGLAAATGHVLLSVLLGFGIVIVGTAFSKGISNSITTATGLVMVVVGTGYGLKKLFASRSEDYLSDLDKETDKGSSGRRIPYFLVLGGALSPDLSILPVFLLAFPAGQWLVIDVALVFAVASILSLTAFLLVGSMGAARVLARIPPKYNKSLVGFVIAAVGVYVLAVG